MFFFMTFTQILLMVLFLIDTLFTSSSSCLDETDLQKENEDDEEFEMSWDQQLLMRRICVEPYKD